MAKRIKPLDLAAAVVWDSNPLFTENETELVSSESSADLQEIQAIDGVQLIIPRVVAGEILFRKDWGLAALRNDAARKLKAIGELVAGEQPSIADKKRLRLQLQRRFINWCTENSIRLWRVPFDKINWRHLTALAVSRLPPFSPFEPKGKSEKGFRDALVLETLCDICESVSPTRTIFICGDKLLGEAAFARLGSKQLSVYKSTAEYLSYVKLQRQNFVDETIKLVIEEATSLFYRTDSLDCVYVKFDIPARLHEALPAEFSKTPALPFTLLLSPPEVYKPTTNDAYRIGTTNIDEMDNDTKVITFKTDVSSARAFQASNAFAPEQLRVIDAVVFWSAKMHFEPDFGLVSPEFISTTLIKTTFETATDELLQSFNLPTFLARALDALKSPAVATEEHKP